MGANVILEGDSIADAALAAREYVENEGMKYINGFDDFDIIAGAGSVGLEILEDAENVDAIVVPVGGGGLIAGIALAVKTINPRVQIIGVEPERCPSMAAAMEAGEVVPDDARSDADGRPRGADGGPRSFEVLRPRVDKLVTVSEKELSVALLRLVELEKLVQEGAGAAGIAAVLAGKFPELKGKNVAVCLCGGNIDTSTLGNVLERGLVGDGRLIRFSCVVPDRPGGIAGLCATIAFVGASIKADQPRARVAGAGLARRAGGRDVRAHGTADGGAPPRRPLAEKYPVDFTKPKSVSADGPAESWVAAEGGGSADGSTSQAGASIKNGVARDGRPRAAEAVRLRHHQGECRAGRARWWRRWRTRSRSSPAGRWTCRCRCTSASRRRRTRGPATATSRAGTSRARRRGR